MYDVSNIPGISVADRRICIQSSILSCAFSLLCSGCPGGSIGEGCQVLLAGASWVRPGIKLAFSEGQVAIYT